MMKTKNDSGAIEVTLIGLLFSLTFSSILISFLLLQAYGYQVTGNQAPISLPDNGVISPIQNYQTNEINDNINYVSKFGSTWKYISGVGKMLLLDGKSYMALKGVQPANDVYTVIYKINNSVKADYGIVLRYTDQDMNQMVVEVKQDGYHIPAYLLLETQDHYFYPKLNANQNERPTIKTVWNDKTGDLQYYEDNLLVFHATNLPSEMPFISATHYYAGVSSSTSGFAVESIDASSIVAGATNIVQQLGAFLDVMAKVVLWNVNSQFLPLELNLLLIKTQLAGVIICVIMILRGN
jgi:hypothetical protein